MGIWLLRRVGQIIPTLRILTGMIFGLQRLMPGDPALISTGPTPNRHWHSPPIPPPAQATANATCSVTPHAASV
jgi:ABC-type dipeptide/oligopeptide/nickel transport system permease component